MCQNIWFKLLQVEDLLQFCRKLNIFGVWTVGLTKQYILGYNLGVCQTNVIVKLYLLMSFFESLNHIYSTCLYYMDEKHMSK